MEKLNIQLAQIDEELLSLPEGELKIYPNNGTYKWYWVNGKGRTYISQKNKKLAEKLTYRKYLKLKREVIQEEKASCYNVLNSFNGAVENLQAFLHDKHYAQILKKSGINNTEQAYYKDWVNQKYNTNPHYLEQLTFVCPSGNYVRSKSEVFIDMVLSQYGIPFRYECELQIGKIKFFPDFTIMNPMTGEILYWEHFGRMDNEEYARNAFGKMKKYYEAGIVPGRNLIMTFETKDRPFSFFDAEQALKSVNL